MLKRIIPLSALCLTVCLGLCYGASKPHVILMAVDDLNDWIGPLGGHPQAKTPGFDYLASKSVVFSNAHCQSPVCNPSRASLMTSLYPSTTGIYFLNPPIEKSPVASKAIVLPKRMEQEGYYVTGAGKLFHHAENQKYISNYAGGFGGMGPFPPKKISPFPGHKLWDWGAFPEKDEDMPDYKIAAWAETQLAETFEGPLFLNVGFYTPHVPQYTPKKWQDLYPLETLTLPEVKKDDLNDLSPYAISLTRDKHVAPTHDWVVENNQWEPLVQTYLACVSFVDAQVMKVITALEKSAYAENTYLVLFSDHGFHLGEKERWAKRSLWQDSTRVPLFIMGPGIPKGVVCNKPVELIDIYPTILDLAGLKADPMHEGQSLRPLLENPEAEWDHPARTAFGPGNYSIVTERYRYIHYNDGSEELYDDGKDPNEWTNQVTNPEYKSVLESLRTKIPTQRHPILGQGSTGHLAFGAAEELSSSSKSE
jgi:arylsulfatase A-like enzyme